MKILKYMFFPLLTTCGKDIEGLILKIFANFDIFYRMQAYFAKEGAD